jgi:hypothetical protein
MLAGLSARQMAEWQAYARIEPFGELRADARAGIIASTVQNLLRGKKSKALKPVDIMPYLKEAQERGRPKLSVADEIREAFGRFKRKE